MAEFEAAGEGWRYAFDAADLGLDDSIPELSGKFGGLLQSQIISNDIVSLLVENRMEEIGQELKLAAEQYILASDPAGRTYVRYGVPHVASAPGQPPAVEPPHPGPSLVESFYTEIVPGPSGEPALVFGNSSPQAEYTEFGTFKMEPRPVLRLVLEAVLAEQGIEYTESAE